MKHFLLTIKIFLFAGILYAQNGSITGVVMDEKLARPIFGAKVFIDGTLYGAMTDMSGKYEIKNIAPGTYNVTCFYLLYGNKKYENIVVSANTATPLEIQMGAVAKMVTGTQVVIKKEKTSEAAALQEIKEETKVVEIVSSQEMNKKGDSKASDAVKRISGVSIVGGKYVYVRGLSDRYTKTILNGSEIPGLDPNRNAVQMDLFPSAFISSIKVIKTFSPDMPGDFTGGLVDIRYKEYPDSFMLNLGMSLGYNPNSSLNKNFLVGKRSSTDWLGYDDGYRDTPAGVSNAVETSLTNQDYWPTTGEAKRDDDKAAQIDGYVKSLNKDMTPTKQKSFLDHSITTTFGNVYKFKLKKDSLKHRTYGFFAGVDYRRTYNYFNNAQYGAYQIGGQVQEGNTFTNVGSTKGPTGNDDVLLGLYLGNTFKFNNNHKLKMNVIFNQGGTNNATQVVGSTTNETSFQFRQFASTYTERRLTSGQLGGEHKIPNVSGKNALELDWITAYTKSLMNNPDMKFWADQFSTVDGKEKYTFQFGGTYLKPARYTRTMNEENFDAKLHATLPVNLTDDVVMKVKAGGSFLGKSRDFFESRVDYSPELATQNSYVNYNGDVNALLQDKNIGWIGKDSLGNNQISTVIENATSLRSRYSATQRIIGVYAMAEIPVTEKLDFIGGARYETTFIETVSKSQTEIDKGKGKGTINQSNILPSLNLVYSLVKNKQVKSPFDSTKTNIRDMKIRLSFNQTLARPNLREIAPYSNYDYVQRVIYTGNPNLKQTSINNYDLRWEYYPKSGELFSVSAFYKDFTDAIELFFLPSGNRELQWQNAKKASVYGLEFEVRKSLEFLGQNLKNFDIGANLTLSRSRIKYTDQEITAIHSVDPNAPNYRQLSGQSPYLINALLEYSHKKSGFSSNITYNIFGKRLAIVRSSTNPGVYEMPYGSLDWNLNKVIKTRLTVYFRMQNLLNPYISQQFLLDGNSSANTSYNEGESYYNRYKNGRRFVLGFNYAF